MENNYRSAFEFALAYIKDENILNKYTEYFKKAGIEITSKKNLQNCIMFAGALFDENVGYSENVTQKYAEMRENIQGDIMFSEEHVKVMKKVLKDLANVVARKDYKTAPENIKHYQETYNKSKNVIDGIYNEELEARQRDFIQEFGK